MRQLAVLAALIAFVSVLVGCGGGSSDVAAPGPEVHVIASGIKLRTAPSLAFDDSGIAHIAWVAGEASAHGVYVASIGNGGRVTNLVELDPPRAGVVADMASVFTAGGDAYVLWWSWALDAPLGGTYTATIARRVGDLWVKEWTETRADGTFLTEPVAAGNARGDAVLAWIESTPQSGLRVAARIRSAQGVWSPARILREEVFGVGTVAAAMDDQGNAVAAWTSGQGSSTSSATHVVATVFGAAAATWSPIVRLDTAQTTASSPSVVGLTGQGFLAVWPQLENDRFVLRSNRNDGTRWAVAPALAHADAQSDASTVRLARNDRGEIVGSWSYRRLGEPTSGIQAALYSESGAAWGPALIVALPSPEQFVRPRVAIGPNGRATAVWSTSSGAGTAWFGSWGGQIGDRSRDWTAPARLDPVWHGGTNGSDVAVDRASGVTVASWFRYRGDAFDVVARVFRP